MSHNRIIVSSQSKFWNLHENIQWRLNKIYSRCFTTCTCWQFFIGLPQFFNTMCICTIFAKPTACCIIKEFAFYSLVIVVRNVNFYWDLRLWNHLNLFLLSLWFTYFIFSSKFSITMRKVTLRTFWAVTLLQKCLHICVL